MGSSKLTAIYSDRIKFVVNVLILAFAVNLTFVGSSSFAQRGGTPFQRGGEGKSVAFPATTTFLQAFQILSQISRDVEGKVIIDPTNQKGPINVSVPFLQWKRALEMILNANGLEYVERATYYEIRPSGSGIPLPSGPSLPLEGALTVDSRQIEISAIFFQGDRGSIAEAGIDWSIFSRGNVNFDVSSVAATSVTQEFLSVAADRTAKSGSQTITTLAILKAFEALNIGRIISKPTVTVLDGVEGMVQVGQSFSIKQRDFAGNTTDEFFEVGTILRVTPKIVVDRDINFIHLKINAEKSAVFPDPVSIRIDKQVAFTEVLLLDGEQTSIAGLFTEEALSVRKGIPILKDLPWWFFGLRFLTGFSSTDISEGELIIVIKATIVPSLTERIERRKADLDEIIKKAMDEFQEDLKKVPLK